MSPDSAPIDYKSLDTLNYPELGTGPVPVAPYVSPAYAERERDVIFAKSWLVACHANEIPDNGDFIVKTVGILKASLIFARGADGVIRGFHNVCTHRGNQIVMSGCKGFSKNNKLVCRFHGWVFGTDGTLVAPTDAEHYFDLDVTKRGLKAVSVSVWKGWVFFNMQAQPTQSLAEFLGTLGTALEPYPSERLKLMSSWSGTVKANWKVVMDGFQEAYHEISVHTRTSPELHSWAENPFARHSYFRPHGLHRQITMGVNPRYKLTPTGIRGGQLLSQGGKAPSLAPGVNPGNIPNFHFDLNGVFPNTLIIPFAGACATMEFIPVAADQSELTVKFYCDGDISWSQRIGWELPIIFYREAVLEDLPVLEATQRGLASGAIQDLMLSDGEIGARHLLYAVDATVRGVPVS